MNNIDLLGLCAEAIGKNGKPRYVFTESGGGWKYSQIKLGDKQGSGSDQAIQKITVEWTAEVTVLCNCPCGVRHGTRVYSDFVVGAWVVHDPFNFPSGLKVTTELPKLIGTLIGIGANNIIGNNPAMVADPTTLTDMANAIRSILAPTTPWDGNWKGKKSPCEGKK